MTKPRKSAAKTKTTRAKPARKKVATPTVETEAPRIIATPAITPPVESPVLTDQTVRTPFTGFAPVLCVLGDYPNRIFGLTTQERIVRQFSREGLSALVSEEQALLHAGPIVFVRGDAVIDQPLVAALIKRPSFVLLSEDRKIIAGNVRARDLKHIQEDIAADRECSLRGLTARAPSEIDVNFWKALRKRETPYALTLNAHTQSAAEWRMFMGTYKGATDIITKHVWPRPAFHVTRAASAKGISPNTVTSVGAALTVLAFVLFLYGHYGFGLLAAWLMTFLDTVDGKLARTTMTSSKWGDLFDHGIDVVHPPFWYAAWAIGLAVSGLAFSTSTFWWLMAATIGGYVLGRAMEGFSIKWLGLEIHIWRKIDTLFRQITARRNPNLLLLTAGWIVGRPDWGLVAVAVWTGICLVLHVIQLLQALQARDPQTGKLDSWMSKP